MKAADDPLTNPSSLDRLRDPSNDKARNRFAEKYRPFILKVCRGRGLQEADAEDVTTFVLLRFFERHRFKSFRYEPPRRFRSWLFTVVTHDLRDYLRSRRREMPATLNGGATSQKALESLEDPRLGEAMAKDLQDIFQQELDLGQQALEIVKERVRDAKTFRIFIAMVFEAASGAELATELGMKLDAVYKARSRVARMVQEEYRKLERSRGDS